MTPTDLQKRATQFTEDVLTAVAEGFETDDATGLTAALAAQVVKFLGDVAPTTVHIEHRVAKFNEDQRKVWGWFSVTSIGSDHVVDHERDVIRIETLQKAAHDYVGRSRKGDQMHDEQTSAVLVDSIVFTREVQKALGIDLGVEGWFGGYHVLSDAAWEKVKSGEYRGFSIGGTAVRRELQVR